MSENKPINRAATFIIDIITKGYVKKNEFIKKFEDNKGNTFSYNTFRRTKDDVENAFKIPIIYNKKENQYEIDKENKKKKKEIDCTFLDSYETSFKSLISENELLIFYSFVKNIIASEVYLPPTTDIKGSDYNHILRLLGKILDPNQISLSEKIEYKSNEHYRTGRRLNFESYINTVLDSFKTRKLIQFVYRPKNKKENEKTRIVQPVKLLHYPESLEECLFLSNKASHRQDLPLIFQRAYQY